MRFLFVDLVLFMSGVIFGCAIMSCLAMSGRESMCETCLYKEFYKRYNTDRNKDKTGC